MEEISLTVKNSSGTVLAQGRGSLFVNLVYKAEYAEGDIIELVAPAGTFLMIQLDDVLEPAYVFMKENRYTYVIPFGEKLFSYNPKTFAGAIHLLKARCASVAEKSMYRNMACNSHDTVLNTVCYPHASANIETRGESVFAARNAIDGNTENRCHGNWPYESWGINKDPNAELILDFGRRISADTLVLYTRADFPHDSWWKQADVAFSDGSTMTLTMEKSVQPHIWKFPAKVITGLKLGKLLKDENDPSPFPALTQIEVYGREAN